jgi:predicted ATP-dependent protease
MISAFTQKKARRDVAMTGEITLRGEVLPIGGVKEKVLAARQAKYTTVILPKLNRRDVQQINPRILHGMTFRYVENVDEVLAIALLPAEPAPGSEPETADGQKGPGGREIPVQSGDPAAERGRPAARADRARRET